jgi:Collagen triple helix repeat (20 copies)
MSAVIEIVENNTATAIVLEVSTIGPTGAQGPVGATGPANVLSVGTVTSGATAAATITGTSPAQVVNFVLPKGDKGDTGAQGIQGIQGSQGIQGLKGDQGDQGIQGLKGDQGIQGIQGIKGDTGDTGAQGIQGIQGLKGDTGATGATGAQGIQGEAGLVGAQGVQGEKGDTGNTGAAATIAVGTVTTSAAGTSAVITNSGTSGAAVFDFTIPRGEAGTGTVNSVNGTGTVNGITLSGTVTTGGNLTLGGTLSNVSLATQVTGTLPVANGGTGATSAAAALTSLGAYPANNPNGYTTNTGTVTSVGGTGTVNGISLSGTVTTGGSLTLGGALSGVNLSTQVTGTLPVANGGTGAATLTANNVLLGNGTSALQAVAPGATGNVLTSNGTTWTSAAGGGGGGTLQAIATGALSNGSKVIINTDGTVSVVSISPADIGPNLLSLGFQNAGETIRSAAMYGMSAVFDSVSNKVVISYINSSNNYGVAIVGTISGFNITFGTEVIFRSASLNFNNTQMTFDSVSGKVVIAYTDGGNSNFGTAIVGTVSGTSISFGTAVVFETSEPLGAFPMTFDSVSGKVVIAYTDRNNSNFGTAIVGTVSGTSISFGTAVVFQSASITTTSSTFDSTAGKVVIFYKNGSSGTAIVGTVSGTSISFGTPVVISSGTGSNLTATFDSLNNKVVAVFTTDLAQGVAAVGTVSGTSISFSSPYPTFDASFGASSSLAATFDSVSGKVVIGYSDGGSSNKATAIVGTVSGAIISFGTPIVFSDATTNTFRATFASTNNKVVFVYRNSFAQGTVATFQNASTTLTAENYIGISNAAYTNGATATIQIVGSVDDAQSGLTAGQSYYVQPNGTLALTPASPSVFAGTAVSATKLIVKG